MVTTIEVSGSVFSSAGDPVRLIRVAAYGPGDLAHTFTEDDGRFSFEITQARRVTLCFDTHPTLLNAREWHPSVAPSMSAQGDIRLDRTLFKAGDALAAIDFVEVLSAYQYLLLWTKDREQAATIQHRLSQTKELADPFWVETRRLLLEHFTELAHRG